MSRVLESILAQSYGALEILVMDIGNGPSVKSTIDTYANARIRYFHHPDIGLGKARRIAATSARGTLISYCDENDYLLPDHCAQIARVHQLSPADSIIYAAGIYLELPTGSRRKLTRYRADSSFLLQYWQRPQPFSSFTFSVELARRVTSENQIVGADFHWLSRLAVNASVMQLTAYSVIRFQPLGSSDGPEVNRRVMSTLIEEIEALYQMPPIRDAVPRRVFRALLTHHYWHWCRQGIRHGQFGLAGYGFRKGWSTASWRSWRALLLTLTTGIKSLVNPTIWRQRSLLLRFKEARVETARQLRLKLRWPVVSWLLQRSTFDSRQAILLFAEARGGSTWLAELLGTLPGILINYEPLHPQHGIVPNELGWKGYPSLSLEADTTERQVVDDILAFRRFNRWTTQLLSFPHLFYRGHQQVLVKFIGGNQLLPFVLAHAALRHAPVFLVRHPLSTAESYLRTFNIPDQRKYWTPGTYSAHTARFHLHQDFLQQLDDELVFRVGVWCVNNVEILHRPDLEEETILVYYEDLLLYPARELERLLDRLNLSHNTEEALQRMNFRRPSLTNHRADFSPDPQRQLTKAIEAIAPGRRTKVQSVLDHFNFKLYAADDPLPKKDQRLPT